jgi:polyhydroxybutyrate depolymerase
MKALGAAAVVLGVLACTACSGDAGAHDADQNGPVGGMAGTDLAGSGGAAGLGGSGGAAGLGGSGAASGSDDAGTDVDAGPVDSGVDAGNGTVRRGTGPGDWVAGDYPPDVHAQTYLDIAGVAGQMGNVRQYKVHVPSSYDAAQPTPLVFCFHGLGQNAVMFCVDGTGMLAKSDAEGFILVMPNGYQNSWNGGTCCGGAATSQLDDVALVRAIFEEVGSHLNVDLGRVYATGLSNGGYMSYRLACQASDVFTAVAPGAGAIGMNDIGGGTSATGDFAACAPSDPVSVLHLHGTADGLIAHSLQKPSLDRIGAANGCLLATHAADMPASAGDTACVSLDGCPAGVDVTGCTVSGGGHVWFGDANCGTGAAGGCAFVGANSSTLVNTDAAWDFFAAHAR